MEKRILTAINYSAGVQSSGILEMVLAGIIPRPEPLLVVNANPGMENSVSYQHTASMMGRCAVAGIEFVTVPGPNLYHDIVTLKDSGKTRLDNPPFWTPSERGRKEGQVTQKCTQAYKVAPMDRAVRKWMNDNWSISPKNSQLARIVGVEKWIGFTLDEQHRADGLMAAKRARYVGFAFPLIAMEMTKSDVVDLFRDRNWKLPPTSLCNACPYMGLRKLKEMHDDRPADWGQAVNVDEAARDLTQIGLNKPCFVSKTLIPLTQLAEMNFELPDEVQNDLHQCSSGACFI